MQPKLLFVVTEDWYFWSHRLAIARAALQHGYDVSVACRANNDSQKIRDAGFRLLPLRLSRTSYSPLAEFRSIVQLREIYRQEQPDVVHHVALKPILYGSIAALGQGRQQTINAFAGLGFLAASSSIKAKLLRPMIWRALRSLLNRPRSHVLLQNQEDRDLLAAKAHLPAEKAVIIPGSGVNIHLFRPTPEPEGVPVVLLASRMLWIKGIQEFVQAAQLLRSRKVSARFVLAGDSDPGSPSCIPRQQLLDWQSSGVVEFWGQQQDMPQTFKSATLVCLPSHGGEGVPKVLMEAAASGRALIATQVPGCKDIVRHGVNGLLVQPRNPVDLADAIERMLEDHELRQQMGSNSREIAVNDFSEEVVVQQTLDLYSKLLSSAAPPRFP